MSAPGTFSPGDRVRVDPEGLVLRWSDPKVDRLVKLGRPGTVKDVAGTALRPEARGYNVKFDVARQGALPVVGWNIPVKYLVAIP